MSVIAAGDTVNSPEPTLIGYKSRVAHPLLLLVQPPNLIRGTQEDEQEDSVENREATEEKVDDTPGGHTTVLQLSVGDEVLALNEIHEYIDCHGQLTMMTPKTMEKNEFLNRRDEHKIKCYAWMTYIE